MGHKMILTAVLLASLALQGCTTLLSQPGEVPAWQAKGRAVGLTTIPILPGFGGTVYVVVFIEDGHQVGAKTLNHNPTREDALFLAAMFFKMRDAGKKLPPPPSGPVVGQLPVDQNPIIIHGHQPPPLRPALPCSPGNPGC